ncbi:hypothetical protein N5K21_21135 [Rhizobium pusense]|uniref:Uncharacterized protein n=1 Tax=Agrobacterium pusense TaxID=648995 RepID=A0A6H0ZKM2_9HYPH|nr:hypothetical protein [Agrobacterium pusense]MDH2091241.1 hypothetical protein [Agrobacterium pusense]QIX21392.1 hypothetical protein FOB41_09700 [Agrobacterium pusense]
MSAIPADIDKVAAEVWATLPKEGAGITAIARAILAERERCADVARRYLEDIAGCNMNDDEPDKIVAAIMDPSWEPPLL